MQRFIANSKYPLLTFMLAFAILFAFYHAVLLSPNSYLFSANGDGIKNYYTYIYHAKYDHSFHEFSGMNYPFYEHIVYTDAHPLLSYLIGKLGLVDYAIGIVNFLMLLSYPICAALLYAILKHYKVATLWAIVGAIVITFLSPQVFRLTGHFSMSYVFAVPLLWYLQIKYLKTTKLYWSLLIGLYLTAFFFTHPYLGMILCFFSIVFWLVTAVSTRKWLKPGLHILVQVIFPILLFQGYVKLTDVHDGRLSDPAGFYDYYASWKSLTIAHNGPLQPLYSALKINIGNWESWAYLGFGTLVSVLIILIFLVKQRQNIDWKGFFQKELVRFVISAYLILLFAFCFPLKYFWMHWLADLISPIKQFRILGRFTWIFFYVTSVTAVVGIYHLYKTYNRKNLKYVFFGGMIFMVFEFYPVHKLTAESITIAANYFQYESLDQHKKSAVDYLNSNDYDAILFVPFTHMSSENIMLLGSEKGNFDAHILSYHTQLPLINSVSSRMSLEEAKLVNNYFSREFIEKELTYLLPENAKIALIKNRDQLKIEELRMIWTADQQFENEDFIIFDFDPKKWNARIYFDEIVEKEKSARQQLPGNWKSETATWLIYEGYDSPTNNLVQEEVFAGSGAYKAKKTSWNNILKLSASQIQPGNYTTRFWYNIHVGRPDMLAIVEQTFTNDQAAEWLTTFDIKQSTHIVDNWCLIEMNFQVQPNLSELNILITGGGSGEPFIVDELLIQKENDAPLFRRDKQGDIPYIIYNNYWIKANSFSRR